MNKKTRKPSKDYDSNALQNMLDGRPTGKNKNGPCPFCGVTLTKATRSREHLIPSTLVPNRSWDFWACHECNGTGKGMADRLLHFMKESVDARSPEDADKFVKELQRSKQTSLVVGDASKAKPGVDKDGEPFVGTPIGWEKLEIIRKWVEFLVKGFYFMQKGRVFDNSRLLVKFRLITLHRQHIVDATRKFHDQGKGVRVYGGTSNLFVINLFGKYIISARYVHRTRGRTKKEAERFLRDAGPR